MPWRQPSARPETDKADTRFSIRYCSTYNEMLWKQTVQAVRMAEVEAIAQLSEVCMLCRPMSARHLLRRGIPQLHSN